jgi:hypothetical protein
MTTHVACVISLPHKLLRTPSSRIQIMTRRFRSAQQRSIQTRRTSFFCFSKVCSIMFRSLVRGGVRSYEVS